MIGCGLAMSFEQLLVARWLTGIGSALQNTGAQLFLADISTPANRAQSLGTNQVWACVCVQPSFCGLSAFSYVYMSCVPLHQQCDCSYVVHTRRIAGVVRQLSACLLTGLFLPLQAAALMGSFMGPALGGVLADVCGLR